MDLALTQGPCRGSWIGNERQKISAEVRLNLVALSYGYRYRLDIRPGIGLSRVEFVRTLREARFVGMPVRRSKGAVCFFKLCNDGTPVRHQW